MKHSTLVSSLFVVVALVLSSPVWAEEKPQGPERWEKDIQKFEAMDQKNPPLTENYLFLGSSSIRMWDLKTFFPELTALNRGFGGSQIEDSIYHFKRLVLPYKPHTIVFYAGDNDINAGKTPKHVFDDFRAFAKLVQRSLPKTRILYVAIKPSIARWDKVSLMRDANAKIQNYCKLSPHLGFLDIDTPMLGEDGKPRAGFFLSDGLHLNAKGYQLWTEIVKNRI